MGVAIVPRKPTPRLGQTLLPAVSVDPTLLLLGVGGLALLMLLLGGRPERQRKKRKKTARKKKVRALKEQIRGIESEE